MKKILLLIVVIVIGIGAYFAIPKKVGPPEESTYTSLKYGISFTYPVDYVLREREIGNAERARYAITIIDKKDDVIRKDSEGPTSIMIDIHQNNLDNQSLDSWFNTSASNGKLGDGKYATTTVAGQEAITYKWSGLYEGETTAFRHKDNIVAIAVTYLTPQDRNIEEYRELMKSIQLK